MIVNQKSHIPRSKAVCTSLVLSFVRPTNELIIQKGNTLLVFPWSENPQTGDLRHIAGDWLLDYWSYRQLMRWLADIGSKAEGASLREREREEVERRGTGAWEREIEIEIKGGSVMVSLLVGRVRTTYKYRGGSGGGGGEWYSGRERERRWDKMGRPW